MTWDTQVLVAQKGQTLGPMDLRKLKAVLEKIGGPPHDAVLLRDREEGWIPLQHATDLINAEVPGFWPQNAPPAAVQQPPQAAPFTQPQVQPQACCPYCGSPHIARAEVIYSQGTATSQVEPDLVYYDGMSQSIQTVGGGEVIHTSELAKKFAPPNGMPMGCMWPMFLIGCVVTFPFAQPIAAVMGSEDNWPGFLLGGGLVIMFVIAALYRIFILEPQLTEYRKQWGCLQCGAKWKP
ncbi:MAG: hypothetical protein AAGK14_02160 [Verrucomicrobiota bacterium]